MKFNKTLLLTKYIGSPFITNNEAISINNKKKELYNFATQNKIGLLYLDSLNKNNELGVLSRS